MRSEQHWQPSSGEILDPPLVTRLFNYVTEPAKETNLEREGSCHCRPSMATAMILVLLSAVVGLSSSQTG